MIPASNSFVNQKRNFEIALVALVSTIQYQRHIDPDDSPEDRRRKRIKHLAITGGAMGGILAQQAILRTMAARAVLVPVTYTAAAITGIYYGGVAWSHAIDEEKGVERFEDYVGIAITQPHRAVNLSLLNTITLWQHFKKGSGMKFGNSTNFRLNPVTGLGGVSL